jgi:hypothetical protein
MPRFFSFLLGMAVGAMLCYAATNYHVVRAQDGLHLIPKVHARLADAYVDVRAFGVGDWTSRPELAAAVVRDNKQHLMGGAATDAVQNGMSQILPNWPQQ